MEEHYWKPEADERQASTWPGPQVMGAPGPKPRRTPVLGLVIGLAVLLAGGGVTWWLWPSSAPAPAANSPEHVVPGTVQALILTPDEVSKAVGTTVLAGASADQPPPALSADPSSCAVAVGPATASGYPKGWTVFLTSTFQDSAGVGDYVVTQTIGQYGDGDQAAKAFQGLSDGVRNCPSATRTDENKNAVKWNYSVDTASADTLAWTAAQDGGSGWGCYRRARLKAGYVLQVAVCEGGDGKPAAAKVAERFAAKVGG